MAAYQQRTDLVIGELTSRGMGVFRPAGALYAWVNVSGCGADSRAFTLRLLSEEGVATAPGSAFGTAGEGFVRMSLAAHPSDLERGCDRMAALRRRMGRSTESGVRR